MAKNIEYEYHFRSGNAAFVKSQARRATKLAMTGKCAEARIVLATAEMRAGFSPALQRRQSKKAVSRAARVLRDVERRGACAARRPAR